MKLSKLSKAYLEELEGAKDYEKMMKTYPEKANYFKSMHDDELKHAKYLIDLFPEIKEEIEEYHKYLKENLEELEEIIDIIK